MAFLSVILMVLLAVGFIALGVFSIIRLLIIWLKKIK